METGIQAPILTDMDGPILFPSSYLWLNWLGEGSHKTSLKEEEKKTQV